MMPAKIEKLIHGETVFRGKRMAVRVDKVQVDDCKPTIREVVESCNAVAILGIDKSNNMIFIRQYRHAVGRILLELPAGKIDPGESKYMAGLREFKEETGYTAGSIETLLSGLSSPGFLTENIHILLATDLTEGNPEPTENENIEVVGIPIPDVLGKIDSGEISCLKSIAAVYAYMVKVLS